MSEPSSSSRLRVPSSLSALSSAADSLSRIGFGVPFGANSAFHAEAWKSGMPASFEVGTFGSDGSRVTPETAIGLSLPLSMCGPGVVGVSNANWTSFASSPWVIGPLPRYGTWIMSMPAMRLNCSVMTCG